MKLPSILLVEDDENDIFFLQRAFEKAQIAAPLHIVRDGQEAIDYFCGNGSFSDRIKNPLPCLTLLDLNLPRKHGFEVLQSLHGNPDFDKSPIVILTSSTSEEDMRQAYNLGANSYLLKQNDPNKLVSMAKGISAYWLEMNQFPPFGSQMSADSLPES
jgi:CheY-like chemotaxis protein